MKLKDKTGKEHVVYQYRTTSNVPRPESFLFDLRAAVGVAKENRQKFFQVLMMMMIFMQ